MEREEAYPSCRVDRILVWMIAAMRNVVRDVVNRDDPVENHQAHKDQNKKRDVVEHVATRSLTVRISSSSYARAEIPQPRDWHASGDEPLEVITSGLRQLSPFGP